MKKPNERRNSNSLRPEYDFASMQGGVRGKHHEAYRKGSNIVVLDPDVAKAFPTEDAVNETLRNVLSARRAVRQAGETSERNARGLSRGSRRRG